MTTTLKERTGTIARQYLARVAEQRRQLHQAVEGLSAGEFHRLGEIYDLARQIHGAAGIFGFHGIATTAEGIHNFVLEVDPDHIRHRIPVLTGLMIDFDLAVSAAAAACSEKRPQQRPAFRQIFRE